MSSPIIKSTSHPLSMPRISVDWASTLAVATANGPLPHTTFPISIFTRLLLPAFLQEISEWFLCRWRLLLVCVSFSIMVYNIMWNGLCTGLKSFCLSYFLTSPVWFSINLHGSCQRWMGFWTSGYVEPSIYQGQLSAPRRHLGLGRRRWSSRYDDP